MHLIALNLPDLILSLLRATLPHDAPDDKDTWDWACLRDPAVWKAHGKLVADATQYLPGSFDRPPRNPAEKISSGYKAWEFLTYVYGFLPGFLRAIQKPHYYKHFCKLVLGVRIVLQCQLPRAQLQQAHELLVAHAEEFETLYYQRREERLHFVRQSLHATTYIVPEAFRIGPGSLYTQWAIENYIGNITREIKQHVTPYANVSERALRRCQANALKAMFPEFADHEGLPRGAISLGEGFVLLRAMEKRPGRIHAPAECDAITAYLRSINHAAAGTWDPRVQRWARVRLPNTQVVRCAWKECDWEACGRHARRARMLRGNIFAEVQYFFRYTIDNKPCALALVSVYSDPDPAILNESMNTLLACTYRGNRALRVINVTEIMAVVTMIPLPITRAESEHPNTDAMYGERYFVVEKVGLDVALMGGAVQDNMGPDPDDPDGDEMI
ncbi:hypothetical protein C2E23DRAFT_724630 [Lenzites betulinus]|nr:hypothetical protein C2E23DRAFT_724630 [Lenzites betulinus]